MKLPRFHLFSVIAFLIGANACVCSQFYAWQGELFAFSTERWSRDEDGYMTREARIVWMRTYDVGWPFSIVTLTSEAESHAILFESLPAEDKRRILAIRPAKSTWVFDRLSDTAPKVHNQFEAYRKQPRMAPAFIDFDRLTTYASINGWRPASMAANSAVIFAIALALAALCEFLLRRKKSAPHP